MGIGKLIKKIQRAVNGTGGEQAQNRGARPKPATRHKSQELSAESLGGHVRGTRSAGTAPVPATGLEAKAKKRKAASPASARRKEAKRADKAHGGEIANPRRARNVQQMDSRPRIVALADVLASHDIGRAPVPVPVPNSVQQELEAYMASMKPAPVPDDTASDSPGSPDWEAPDDPLQLFAGESFVSEPHRIDEEIRAYSLLRLAGLDEYAAKDVAQAQRAGVSASRFQEFFGEAASNRFVKYDFEAAALYCAARALGYSPTDAELVARYGPLYLESSMNPNGSSLQTIRAKLHEYGLPDSPMGFPRKMLHTRMDEIGAGSFSKVFRVEINGERMAFKPFKLPEDQKDASISDHGLMTGIREENHYSALRHIAVTRAQEAMGLTGKDAVVGDAEVAIINGKPGLLMKLAKGIYAPQAWYDEDTLDEVNKPDHQELRKELDPYLPTLEDPETREAQLKLLGIYDYSRDPVTGKMTFTGTAEASDPAMYANPGFRRTLSNAQYLAFIMNIADLHYGNLFIHQRKDGEYKVTMIDVGDCLGRLDIRHLLTMGRRMVDTYRLAQEVRYVDAALIDRVQERRCKDLLENLKADLEGYLDTDEIAGMDERILWVEQNRADAKKTIRGKTKVLDGSEAWRSVKMRSPFKSWIGKFRGLNPNAEIVIPASRHPDKLEKVDS